MADIFFFKPRAELDAAANLKGFIDSSRTELTTFGADLDFDGPKWDLTNTVARKAIPNAQRVIFSTLKTAKNKKHVELMHDNFRPFAQAYFRSLLSG